MTTQTKEKVDPLCTTVGADKNRRVLLLNASEEIIGFISWQRAATLYFTGKAAKPYNYEHFYTIKGVNSEYTIPAAIMLAEYVRMPMRKAFVTKKNVLRRDKYMCQYCGKTLTASSGTIDHVMPQSRNGGNEWTNLVSACYACNCKKGNRTPKEASMKLHKEPKAPEMDLIHLRAMDADKNPIWDRWIRVSSDLD